jgi:hypothetical protein
MKPVANQQAAQGKYGVFMKQRDMKKASLSPVKQSCKKHLPQAPMKSF